MVPVLKIAIVSCELAVPKPSHESGASVQVESARPRARQGHGHRCVEACYFRPRDVLAMRSFVISKAGAPGGGFVRPTESAIAHQRLSSLTAPRWRYKIPPLA